MDIVYYLRRKLFKVLTGKSYFLFPKRTSISVSADLVTGRYVNVNISKQNVTVEINRNVTFREFCNILISSNGVLRIGKNVFFNNYCSINCLKEISVGNNTLFGEGVKLYDHNHEYIKSPCVKVHSDRFTIAPINIGENCWIGSNVTILKGLNIGDNVIIGANCLIYKSVPSNSIVKAGTSLIIEPML